MITFTGTPEECEAWLIKNGLFFEEPKADAISIGWRNGSPGDHRWTKLGAIFVNSDGSAEACIT